MSTTIDERVVEMRFDNQQFERNVQTTMSTIEKLKQSLNFSGSSNSLEKLNAAAGNCNMSGLSSGVDTVRMKFSALEVMAVTALANITNSAVETGKRMVAAFTIDPVKSGFQEYETQINAIQTILANTSSKGTTLEQVTAALDELNYYADKTIYNFTEMTRNIGTFTAAGVDLDTSVSAIQGIANLAAVSGSTSQQASTAMYQLSQALAAGTVKLMDWNSVVNAGMGGEVFQKALKETARLHGVAIDQMIEDEGSFRETLSKGWLSSEILTETLKKFTTSGVNEYLAEYTGLTKDAIAEMREQAIATGDSSAAFKELAKDLAQNCSLTEDQIYELLNMSQTAEDAATKVKTFTQLMDTLKEAAQSGWTKTWEILIGDFEEAKELFTELSDLFGGIIERSANARNEMLEGAMSSNWDKLKTKITETGIAADDFQNALKETAKAHGIAIDDMIAEEGSFEKTLKNGWLTSNILIETLNKFVGGAKEVSNATADMTDKVSDFQAIVSRVIKGDFGNGAARVKALTEAGYDYATVQGMVNTVLAGGAIEFENLSDAQLENIGYTEEQIAAIKELARQAEETGTPINELIANLEKPSGRELLIDSFRNALYGLLTAIGAVRDAWQEIFPPTTSEQLYGIIEGLHTFSEHLRMSDETADKLKRTFKGLFALLSIFTNFIGGGFKVALNVVCKLLGMANVDVLGLTASVGDTVVAFRDWLLENNLLVKGLEKLGEYLVWGAQRVSEWLNEFMKLPVVQQNIRNFELAFANTLDELKLHMQGGMDRVREFIQRVKEMDSITLADVGKIFKDFKDNVIDYFLDVEGKFDNIKLAVQTFKDSVKQHFAATGESVDVLKSKFSAFFDNINIGIGEVLTIGVGAGLIIFVKKLADALETLGGSIANFSMLMSGLQKVLNSYAFKIKAEALVKVATAIAVLAGALVLLTQVDQAKLWSAVGVLGVLAGGLVALSAALGAIEKVGDFGKASLAIIAIAGSLLILSTALKQMEGLDGEKVWGNMGILAVLAAGLVTVSAVLSKVAPQLSKNSLFLLSFSTSLKILVSAVKGLEDVDAEKIKQSVPILLGAIGGLALVAAACKNVKIGAAATVLAIAIALKSLISSFEKISELDSDKMKQNIGAFIAIFGMFGVLMAASSLSGANAAKAGLGIIGMSTALLIIVQAFKAIGDIDPLTLDRATATVSKLLLVFAAVTVASNFAGKNATKAGAMLLLMSGAILILSGVMVVLSHLEPEGLDRALDAIVKMELAFAAIIALTSIAKQCKETLVLISVALGLLAVALGTLSMIEPERLDTASDALSKVMAMFSLMVASTSIAKKANSTIGVMVLVVGALAGILALMSELPAAETKIIADALAELLLSLSASLLLLNGVKADAKKALTTTGVMVLIIGALGGILALMSELPVNETLVIATALSELLLSLSASLVLLSFAKTDVKTALTGVESMGVLIGGVGGLMAALGALVTYFPDIELFLDKGLPILEKIGYGLGLFFGNIVGGFSAGATSGLPEIGTNLSTFMDNAQPFFTGIKGVDADTLTGVKTLAETILILTAADILNGLTSWLTGGASVTRFGEELKDFGIAFNEYAKSITNVEPEVVTASANAAKTLAEFASAIPNQGGLVSLLAGENSLAKFAEELIPFGINFAAYAATISGKDGIDAEVVTASANAALALAKFAQEIPNSGGKLAEWLGDNTLSSFAAELVPFGDEIKKYSLAVDGLKADVVQNSVNAALALAELANKLPNQGGLVSWFTGDNRIDKFGKDLKTFGTKIKEYADEVDGLKADVVQNSVNAALALAGLATNLPNSGGLLSFFTGDNNIGAFGKSLIVFGKNFADYSGHMENVKPDVVRVTTYAANCLVGLQNGLPDKGGLFSKQDTLESFGKGLASFGLYFFEYYNKVSGVNPAQLTSVVDETKMLVQLAKIMESIDMAGMNNFGKALGNLGETGISQFIAAFENSSAKVKKAGEQITDNAVDGLQSNDKEYGKIGEQYGNDFYSNLANTQSLANNAGKEVTNKAETGLRSNLQKYAQTGLQFGNDFVNSLSGKGAAALAAGQNLTNQAKSGIESNSGQYGQLGSQFGTTFANSLSNQQSAARNAGVSVVSGALQGMREKVQDFVSIGTNIAEGLARGIRNNQSIVNSAMSAMASSTYNAGAKKLGIHSPSKVFEKFGEYVDLGFIQGLNKLSGDVEKTSGNLGLNAISAMSDAITNISDMVDSNINTEPTIRPVLDLTSFKSGEKNLNSIVNGWNGLSVSADLAASASKSMTSKSPGQINQNEEISALRNAINKLADKPEMPNQDITIYITGTDPKAIADEVSRRIQRAVERRDASWA